MSTNILSIVPDHYKAGVAVTPAVLDIAGFPVEQWMFVLSGIVSILFIIEKIPMLIERIKMVKEYINARRKKQRKD